MGRLAGVVILVATMVAWLAGCGGAGAVNPPGDGNGSEEPQVDSDVTHTMVVNGAFRYAETKEPMSGVELILKFGANPYKEPFGDALDVTDEQGAFLLMNSREAPADELPYTKLAVRFKPAYYVENPTEFEGFGDSLFAQIPFELADSASAWMTVDVAFDETGEGVPCLKLLGNVLTDGHFTYDGEVTDTFEYVFEFGTHGLPVATEQFPEDLWGEPDKRVFDAEVTGEVLVKASNNRITLSGDAVLSMFGIELWTGNVTCGVDLISTQDHDLSDEAAQIQEGMIVGIVGMPHYVNGSPALRAYRIQLDAGHRAASADEPSHCRKLTRPTICQQPWN